jgi:hypothetical protein
VQFLKVWIERLAPTEKDKEVFTFNVYLPYNPAVEESEVTDGFFYRGLRLMKGMIYPPSAKVGHTWKVITYFPLDVAKAIFAALKEKPEFEHSSLISEEEIAIHPLLLPKMEAVHSVPERWKKIRTTG